ncbi:MAG TPA: SCO family protein, partial [Thermoanaerobaculia bacterium]|nr:SCO family protein [Thermoanaerobaculia bacterium]
MKALRVAAIGAAVLLGMLGLHQLVYALMSRGHAADLPKHGRVPDFAFVSESGRPVSARDLEGKVWIADFIFTRCGGTCPAMSQRMADLAEALKDAPRVVFVSFDVDPEHDSLADLATYSRQHGADPGRWTFLRGERPAVRALAGEGFKLAVVDGRADDPEPILHSSHFVLVDGRREIRGYYDGLEAGAVEKLAGHA